MTTDTPRIVAHDLRNTVADIAAMQRYMRAQRTYIDPAEYANPVHVYKRPLSERAADVIFATVLGVVGAALLVHLLAR